MTTAAVRSEAAALDLLLLIHCFMYLPMFVGVLYLVFVLLCIDVTIHFFQTELNPVDFGSKAEKY